MISSKPNKTGFLHRIHHHGRRHISRRPYILPLFGVLLGIAVVVAIVHYRGGTEAFRPSDSHVVFVFDGGKKQTVDTKAQTVGQLVGRLNLHLIPQDLIEPDANTQIVEDNFRINIYRARPVTIVDGSHKIVTLTAQKSARVVAQSAGLKINPEDLASFADGNLRQNTIGEQVVVARATPIKLNLYGTEVPTYTQAHTVAAMLQEKDITLNSGESVQPSPQTAITPGMRVFILAKGSQVITTEENITPPVNSVRDYSLSFGTKVVRQQGEPGKEAVTYLISNKDGKETGRKIIQRAIVESPVPEIVAVGATIDINGDKTAVMAQAGIASSDYAYANFIVSHESNWHVTAANPSGAYGLCQALPGSKMASAGSDWETNPVTQLRWCSSYAGRDYGGWAGAYNHWLNYRSW